MRGKKTGEKIPSSTVHIRVQRETLQKLRVAIVHNGGVFHGRLQVETENALRAHIARLEAEAAKKAKAEADPAEVSESRSGRDGKL